MGSSISNSYAGTRGSSQPYSPSYHVESAMYRMDILNGTYHDGHYDKNPTARNINDLINGNYIVGKTFNAENMPYVIDLNGNIILGKRNGNGRDGLPTPHPTLIGGKDPQVQMAGLVRIRGGKIISYDNRSGHYKPNIDSMAVADQAFSKLSATLFNRKRR